MSTPLKILFCLNLGAGREGGRNWEEEITTYFQGMEHSAIMLPLEGDMKTQIRQAIKQENPHRVVAVGGDGTVNLVAQVVGGTGLPMGVVPAGSANGMATDLGIPTDLEESLALIISATPRPIDAILINEKDLCIHLSDLGLNARMIKSFEQTEARGMWAYAKLSIKALLRMNRFRVRIITDREEVVRSAFMVVLANARKYGTGATINTIGKLDDGLFEVVLVRHFGLREGWQAWVTKRRFDPERIEILQAREVEISTREGAHFQVDGDHKGKVRNVKARILPRHITMLY